MKYTIAKIVAVYDKSSKGVPYMAKTNKPYKKATLKFVETGEKLVSANQWDGDTFREGQVVEGDIESREYNGKTYYDFKAVSKKEQTNKELEVLKLTVARLDLQMKQVITHLKEKITPSHPVPNFDTDSQGKTVGNNTVRQPAQEVFPEDDINPEDIPF